MDVGSRELGVGSLELVRLDPRIRREVADHTATSRCTTRQPGDADVFWKLLLAPGPEPLTESFLV